MSWPPLKYRITDPIAFHFDFANAPAFITNALNNALLFAASQFPVDDILTRNRAAFRERVMERARELIDSQKLGVTLDQLDVDASPPLYLKPKFDEVDTRPCSSATKPATRRRAMPPPRWPKRRGEAATRVFVADALRKRMVDMVTAQADTFQKLRGQYERDPAFFERVRQMTVLEKIYTNALQKIIMPPNAAELRLELSREPQAPSTNNIHHVAIIFMQVTSLLSRREDERTTNTMNRAPVAATITTTTTPSCLWRRRSSAWSLSSIPLSSTGSFFRQRQPDRRGQRHDRRHHPGLPDCLDRRPGFAPRPAHHQ